MSVTVYRDLRSALAEARDQGSRATCCAFACSDLHAAIRTPWNALSCEYLHYQGAKRRGTGPNVGVPLATMRDVLQQHGQPPESSWPYSLAAIGDAATWTPPASIGTLFRANGMCTSSNDVAAVRSNIDAGRPAVIVMTLSNAFVYSVVDADGVIDSAEPTDPKRVHAVVAVGHGKRAGEAVTLVRNSWGSNWGVKGHAWLTDRYLQPRLLEWATLTKVA